MNFNCIAIDDDLSSLETLSDYVYSLGNYHMLKTFTDPVNAMNFLQQETDELEGRKVDIIFLDVEMPRMSGLELFGLIRSKAHYIIFTTAHLQYALDAFEIRADAFLLKPFSIAKFAQTLNTLPSLQPKKNTQHHSREEEFFFIKSKNEKSKLVKIRFDEIIAIESIQNYISIYTKTKTVVALLTLTKIKEILNKRENFMQIHRSFIISRDYIDEVENSLIRMQNNLMLTVGENYRLELYDFIRDKTIKTGKSSLNFLNTIN
ncbi:DNA-binding response regulator [Pedobacter chinensis]|uniref:DNA-binding response regulator n=1 Tax=Pedobacter chinensis TaxID=2282421 RepID=A0A369PUC4_9SPHI|nr:LytTR family DNA-binding domain-containing protein [Pedobacter chinensis]RDC55860.1 DNA-binding response regulator [Pedobacter chinensis]